MQNYLTYEEYSSISTSNNVATQEDFVKYANFAAAIIDAKTKYFYDRVDFETDFPKRKEAFKLALVSQIDYYNQNGTTSAETLSDFDSVSIGRTSLSKGNRASNKTTTTTNQLSKDAYFFLLNAGFLFSSVCTI